MSLVELRDVSFGWRPGQPLLQIPGFDVEAGVKTILVPQADHHLIDKRIPEPRHLYQ